MNNHFVRYQNDVNNTASNLVTQMVCAERGLDYNQVVRMAEQAHINGIFQQEQRSQFNQMLNRHYGGGGIVSKIKDVFTGGSNNFFPMMGTPNMPMSPMPAFMPQVSGPMSPQQAAGILSTPPQAVNTLDTQQLQKDVDELRHLVTNLVNALQQPQQTQPAGQQQGVPPIF